MPKQVPQPYAVTVSQRPWGGGKCPTVYKVLRAKPAHSKYLNRNDSCFKRKLNKNIVREAFQNWHYKK